MKRRERKVVSETTAEEQDQQQAAEELEEKKAIDTEEKNNGIDPSELTSDDPCDLMSEEEVEHERQLVFDELRGKNHTFELSNQSVIELAYLTKDMVELCIKGRYKLAFEEANCYYACYYICRRLLKSVDPLYLDYHQHLYEFYHRKDNKRLSNDWDILMWEDEEEQQK